MTIRLPKGADILADIRRQGWRPELPVSVFIDIDRPPPRIWGDMPNYFEICTKPTDLAPDLDFWPLYDLDVTVHCGTVVDGRMRAILKQITRFKPRFLMGGVPTARLLFAWHPLRGWEFDYVL